MPAAENTNNFWNLGEETADFPGTGPPRSRFCPQITQILKEEGINSYESRRMRKIWPDTRCLPRHGEGDAASCSKLCFLGVWRFLAACRRSSATAGRWRVFGRYRSIFAPIPSTRGWAGDWLGGWADILSLPARSELPASRSKRPVFPQL